MNFHFGVQSLSVYTCVCESGEIPKEHWSTWHKAFIAFIYFKIALVEPSELLKRTIEWLKWLYRNIVL